MVRLLIEILIFKRMIAPVILQILFWAGVFGCLYGAYVLYKLDNWAWPFPLFLGPLLVRVLFEQAILAYRAYDRLSEISKMLAKQSEDQ